jgi:hypothetical protein
MKNNLKTYLSIALFFAMGSVVFSQTAYHSDLLKKFSVEELNQMAKSNPNELLFLNEFVVNGFYVTDFPQEKAGAPEINGARKIDTLDAIDFFALNIPIKENDWQYYMILGTDKLLVVKSRNYVLNEMKK